MESEKPCAFPKTFSLLLVGFGPVEPWGLGGEPSGGGDRNQSKTRDKAGKGPRLWHPSEGASPKPLLMPVRESLPNATAGLPLSAVTVTHAVGGDNGMGQGSSGLPTHHFSHLDDKRMLSFTPATTTTTPTPQSVCASCQVASGLFPTGHPCTAGAMTPPCSQG